MTKEQILELISKYVTSTAAEMIAAEFEKKDKEAVEFAKFALWYYNDSLYSKTITWEELKKIYELFKKEKA